MVSKPDYYLNLNLCDPQTQSLASCELLVWNFFKCFLTLKGFRSSFDIVQFSRSCAPHPLGWAAHLLYLIRCRLSSTFLRFFRSGLFSALPPRRVPDYITTPPPDCQHLFSCFFLFFCGGQFSCVFCPADRVFQAGFILIYRKKQPRRLSSYRCASMGFFKPARISL